MKTLKDLEFGRTEKEDREILKKEAIKWIKRFLGEKRRLSRKEDYYWVIVGKIGAIKDFFNITEEDLE